MKQNKKKPSLMQRILDLIKMNKQLVKVKKEKTDHAETIVLNHHVQNNIQQVYESFCNPLQYDSNHPYIFHVQQLNLNTFEFHEKTSLFFIPMKFTYKVKSDYYISDQGGCMETEIKDGVRLNLAFQLQADQQVIRENIAISAPYLLRKLLLQKMKKAHLKMITTIKNKYN